MNDYKRLKIWSKSLDLAERIYSVYEELPQIEKYGLNSQMKRSSVSIPSNVAEGGGRNSTKEFLHFLSIANGSTCELETQLILSKRLKLIQEKSINEILGLCKEIKNINFSRQKSLKSIGRF